jgi:hypothetical protein
MLLMARLSVQSINVDFFRWAEFTVGFRLRRTLSKPHRKPLCGLAQRKKSTFMDGNKLMLKSRCPRSDIVTEVKALVSAQEVAGRNHFRFSNSKKGASGRQRTLFELTGAYQPMPTRYCADALCLTKKTVYGMLVS